MKKSLKKIIEERDLLYSEYIKEISRLIGGKISRVMKDVIFGKTEVDITIEDINFILENNNYVSMILSVIYSEKAVKPKSMIFTIPIDILEHGDESDIKEYIIALKNNDNEKSVSTVDEDVDFSGLDEAQISLMRFMQLKNTKH